MEYKLEEIKAVAEGGIMAQVISILRDRNLGKNNRREMNTGVINSLKEQGVDFENPKKLIMFFIYLQEYHPGLYLLLKTLFGNLLMANPEDCDIDDKVFSEESFGMSKTDHGFLIRGINAILFLFEAIYHMERKESGKISLYMWGACKEILDSTLDAVAKLNGINKTDLEFSSCLKKIMSKYKAWSFFLQKILAILNEDETLDENVKYFQSWWNGEDIRKEPKVKIEDFDEIKNIPEHIEELEDIQSLKRQQMEELNDVLQSLEKRQKNKEVFGC